MKTSTEIHFVHELSHLDAIEAVQLRLAREIGKYGFTNFACSEIPQHGEALEPLWLTDQWNREWKSRYLLKDYVARDPMVRELLKTYLPYRWSEVLGRRRVPTCDLVIVNEAAEFGMRDGFVVPLHSLNGRMAVVTMAGPDSAIDDPRARGELLTIAAFAHARLRELQPLAATRRYPQLPRRERECLSWVAAGKSDWEIGEILQLSERTVHKYIESAKRRFNVATRVQAVVEAIRSHQIAP